MHIRHKAKHLKTEPKINILAKVFIAIFMLVIFAFYDISGTLSYFTSRDEVVNEFTLASTYTVQFNANNGTVTLYAQWKIETNEAEVVGDQKYETLKEAVTRAKNLGGHQIVKILKNIQLPAAETVPSECDITLNLPTPTRQYKNFVGWFTDPNPNSGTQIEGTETIGTDTYHTTCYQ